MQFRNSLVRHTSREAAIVLQRQLCCDSFASIARTVRIPDAENQLRLLNGYYPSGEPRAGDWLKIVKDQT